MAKIAAAPSKDHAFIRYAPALILTPQNRAGVPYIGSVWKLAHARPVELTKVSRQLALRSVSGLDHKNKKRT
jgi:hypothetical protein